MKNLLRKVKELLDYIRCTKNRKEFEKCSIYGKDLVVRFTSHCSSMSKRNIIIGDRCEIKGSLMSFEEGKIRIGSNVFMSFNSYIGSMDSITIGDDVIIATNVRIFDNNNHPTSPLREEK